MAGMMDMFSGLTGNQALLRKVSAMLGTGDDRQDQAKAQDGIAAAIPALLGGLSKKAEAPGGKEEVDRMLDGADAAGADDPGASFDDTDGKGAAAVTALFGDNRGKVEEKVAKAGGFDVMKAGGLLAGLAGPVMAVLGKAKQSGFDVSQLSGMLSGEGGIKGFLDVDGDRKIELQDVKGLVSKLFGKKDKEPA